ncbi:MAG TPA: PKD domain-containing protein [Holophagaceae bacterium]|jgi:hypothetical protein|nr:PKD domain-containing protein [Holophagaceae bacterium]
MRLRTALAIPVLALLALTPQVLRAQCGGYERWAVKVGTDPSAPSIDIINPTTISIQDLIAIPSPSSVPSGNDGTRLSSEMVVYTVTCRLVQFKQEGGTGDLDYHMVFSDDTMQFTDTTGANAGHSFVGESVNPGCIMGSHNDGPSTSTWQSQIAALRSKIDARFPSIPASSWVDAKGVQVRVTGVCFFDRIHGQTGRTNGASTGSTFELHPVLAIDFLDTPGNTVTASITTPSADTSVMSGVPVSFAGAGTDSSSAATLSYSWDFGDQTTAAGNSASHAFTNAGTSPINQTVIFTATDETGASSSATRVITVNPASVPPATSYTEVEPNDTFAQANIVGDTVTQIIGYFPNTADMDDYFQITVPAGSTLTMDMAGPTDFSQEYDLYLYASDQSTQLASSTNPSTTQHISWTNTDTTAATVYIDAYRYKNYSATTPYTLTLSR